MEETTKKNSQIDKEAETKIYQAMDIAGPNSGPVAVEDSTVDSPVESNTVQANYSEDEDEDELPEEEFIRLVTKDGVDYLLNAPLPPSKGFIINDEGIPIIWNPMTLRMEPYFPEDVKIKKISVFRFGSEDVFRIFCLAEEGSEYKEEGLAVIRTIPFSEISSWDTITDENNLISSEEENEQE